MTGYELLIAASEGISEEDIRAARWNSAVAEKLDGNPLEYLIFSLVSLLETDSEESQQRDKTKKPRYQYDVVSPSPDPSLEYDDHHHHHRHDFAKRPSTPQPRRPGAMDPPVTATTTTKRKVSDSSFGTKSTENTPTKLVHPEAKVQSLQDIFVSTVLKKLWWGHINVDWAKGRHMILTYAE